MVVRGLTTGMEAWLVSVGNVKTVAVATGLLGGGVTISPVVQIWTCRQEGFLKVRVSLSDSLTLLGCRKSDHRHTHPKPFGNLKADRASARASFHRTRHRTFGTSESTVLQGVGFPLV